MQGIIVILLNYNIPSNLPSTSSCLRSNGTPSRGRQPLRKSLYAITAVGYRADTAILQFLLLEVKCDLY